MKLILRLRTARAGLVATALVLALALGACSDDGDSSSSTSGVVEPTEPSTATTAPIDTIADATTTEVPDTSVENSEPDTTAVAATDAPATDAPTTVPPSTAAPTTTVVLDALQSLPGVASIEVTIDGVDSTRPNFSWASPAGATSYQLTVQTADGVPLWGWTGDATSVVIGGVERPANVEGPSITGPSQVRVYAFDAANQLVAVSAWTPVSVG